jgi:hypothetical protein
MTNDILKYAVVSVASAAVGSGITYLAVRNRLKKRYSEMARKDIQEVKENYKLIRKEGKYADPATALLAYQGREEELHDIVENAKKAALYQAESDVEEAAEVLEEKVEIAEEVEEAVEEGRVPPRTFSRAEAFVEEPRVHHIFDPEPEEAPEIDGVVTLDRSRPYLIPEEVFMDEDEDQSKFSKITITYWEEDDTLCDEREAIIPDIEGTVGAINLHSFGQNEGQRDVIYVRNERLKADYEIVRESASYSKVILGLKDDEDRPKVPIRRMRGYDE